MHKLTIEVANWLYNAIDELLNFYNENDTLEEEFHNEDLENFTVIIEMREKIDGIRWFDVYQTAWFDGDGKKEWFPTEFLFSLRENSLQSTIEEELNRVDYGNFYYKD